MWPAFLIGLLSEYFTESKKLDRFLLKGFASGIVGIVLNLILWLLISDQALTLIGYTLTLPNVTLEFMLVPFVVAFVALVIVKSARYFSQMGIKTDSL